MVVTLTHTPPTACVFMEFFPNSVSLGVSAQIRFGAASGAGSGWFWRFRWVFLVPGSSGKVWFRSGQFQEVAVRVPGWFWEPVQGSGLVPAGSANAWLFLLQLQLCMWGVLLHLLRSTRTHTHSHIYIHTLHWFKMKLRSLPGLQGCSCFQYLPTKDCDW